MPNVFENIFIPLNVIYKKARTIKTSPVERPNFSVNMLEWLRSALTELNITPGSNCDCPPKAYQILDICKNTDTNTITVTYEPHFTYNYPLTIFTSLSCATTSTVFPYNTNHYNYGNSYTTQSEMITNIDYVTIYTFLDGMLFSDRDVLTFQVTDNKGNYSEPYSINFSDIPTCS